MAIVAWQKWRHRSGQPISNYLEFVARFMQLDCKQSTSKKEQRFDKIFVILYDSSNIIWLIKNSALTEVRAQFQDIVDMVNRLQPAQFFASSSRVFKSSAHKKLNLKILALSESLDQFALSDNHVRNCIELINAEDAQKVSMKIAPIITYAKSTNENVAKW